MKKVAIIMGSDSDFPIVSKAIKQLKDYEVPFEVHVMSAHRTPDEASEFAKNAIKNGFGVIIGLENFQFITHAVLGDKTTKNSFILISIILWIVANK